MRPATSNPLNRLAALECQLADALRPRGLTLGHCCAAGAALKEIQRDALHQQRGLPSFPLYCAQALHMDAGTAAQFMLLHDLYADYDPERRVSWHMLVRLGATPEKVQYQLWPLLIEDRIRGRHIETGLETLLSCKDRGELSIPRGAEAPFAAAWAHFEHAARQDAERRGEPLPEDPPIAVVIDQFLNATNLLVQRTQAVRSRVPPGSERLQQHWDDLRQALVAYMNQFNRLLDVYPPAKQPLP